MRYTRRMSDLERDLQSRPQPCRVYRNIRRACWSIQQRDGSKGWRVVAHATWAHLTDASFVVSQAGRARVLRQGRKNVHAYVVGNLTGWGSEEKSAGYVDKKAEDQGSFQVVYNPWNAPRFEALAKGDGEPMRIAMYHADKALLGNRLWVPSADATAASLEGMRHLNPGEV